jgi:hypothetical protein
VREGLVHSMQHNAEVDEPEPTAVPTLPYVRRPVLVGDDRSNDTVVDVMTEEKLQKGLAELTPMVLSIGGGGSDADSQCASQTTAVLKGDR